MDIKALLETHLFEIGGYTFTAAMLGGLLFVWGLTWFLLRLFYRVMHRGKLLPVHDLGRRHSLFLIVQYVGWVIAAGVMLEIIGVHVSVLLAGSAALLVGLGLGVQQIFRDIVSGVFLLFEGTVEVGDVLQVSGTTGRVVAINLRTSELVTPDGLVLIIPNHKFITEDVLNRSYFDTDPSRYGVTVGVSYAADAQVVHDVMRACADHHPDVLGAAPEDAAQQPQVRLVDFSEEKMQFELTFWTHRKFEVDAVRSDLRFAIRRELAQRGISMTVTGTSYTLHGREGEGKELH